MSIVAKDDLKLTIEDSEATIRAAAQLHFSRQRARWLATHGAQLAEQVNAQIMQGGVSSVSVEGVVRMIEAADDSCA